MKRIAILILAAAAFLAADAPAQFVPPRSNATAKLGDKAPKFEGLRWVQGQEFGFDPGRISVVVFWELLGQQMPNPSREVIPRLGRFWNTHKDKNVMFAGITYESEKEIETFVKNRAGTLQFPIAVDGRRKTFDAFMKAFGVNTIPHAFIIDADGKLFWHGHPAVSEFEMALDQALSTRSQNYVLKSLGGGRTVWERRSPLASAAPNAAQPQPAQAHTPQPQPAEHPQPGGGEPAPIRARPATTTMWQHPLFPWNATAATNEKIRDFLATAAQTEDEMGRITAIGMGDEFCDYTLVMFRDVPVSIEKKYHTLGLAPDQNLTPLQDALVAGGFGWLKTPMSHPDMPVS
ncbi:MAG: redoxin domain-containing protein, partial [Kiritimatiellaeota bacterium]|nr:redoxin domain-containing protein [Kiritimatiellota bacterium]